MAAMLRRVYLFARAVRHKRKPHPLKAILSIAAVQTQRHLLNLSREARVQHRHLTPRQLLHNRQISSLYQKDPDLGSEVVTEDKPPPSTRSRRDSAAATTAATASNTAADRRDGSRDASTGRARVLARAFAAAMVVELSLIGSQYFAWNTGHPTIFENIQSCPSVFVTKWLLSACEGVFELFPEVPVLLFNERIHMFLCTFHIEFFGGV